MNAYELAEKADGLVYEIPADWSSGEPKNVATDIANMLRQQADRIAELEKQVQSVTEQGEKFWQQLCELKAKQKKQSEPVVWWTGRYEDEGEDFMFPNTRQAHIDHPKSCTHKFFPIPLYTTPQTKPLSDEEIDNICQEIACECQHIETDEWIYRVVARAIEERHGIK